MKQSAVSSVFRKLVGAFQNYFMLFMSYNQACARLKFLSPSLTLVNRWLLRSIRIARRATAAVTWFSDYDITLKWRKKNSKTKQEKKWKDEEKRKKICPEHLLSFVSWFLSKNQSAFRTEWISPGAPFQQRDLLPVKGFPVITCSLFYCQTIGAFLSFCLLDYGVFEKWIQ